MTTVGPQELLQHCEVPGAQRDAREPIYVLGSFERRVTLYSQQVRALNLAYALFETRRLRHGSKVAVIGGGAAGISVAVGLAHLGAAVQLIEQTDVLMPLQRACRTRWLHPHIYNWPDRCSDEDDNEAELPLVGWRANYAHDVARSLENAVQQTAGRRGSVQLTLRAVIDKIESSKKLRISWRGLGQLGSQIRKKDEEFHAAIIAVGFGIEEPTKQFPTSLSYWRNDDLDQPVLKPGEHPARCLVSGNGDGGVIDVLRLRIRDFRLESLHGELRKNLKPAELQRLASQVRAWEREASEVAAEDRDDWLWKKYKSIELQKDFISYLKQRLLRSDTRVWIAAQSAPITFRSAILNRLWVALLLVHDKKFTIWIPARTRRVVKKATGTHVTFDDAAAVGDLDPIFDRVIVRHGPTPAFSGPLQWIHERCRPVLEARNALDHTRWPIWQKDVTFGPESAALTPMTASSTKSILPRAQPQSPESPFPASLPRIPASTIPPTFPPPLDSVPDLSPGGRPFRGLFGATEKTTTHSIIGRVERDIPPSIKPSRIERSVLEELSAGPPDPELTFLDPYCIDPDRLLLVTRAHTPQTPVLRWHASILRAVELILDTANRLDDVAQTLSGDQRDGVHHLNVPAFKQAFFDSLERLMRAKDNTPPAFDLLWSFLADEKPKARASAVRTFCAFSALQMIARLREFEGKVRTSDGQEIVNLFPDLPPIRSTWLLRRVPYRSRIGGLALGKEHFLLCKLSNGSRRDNYFLLPQDIAESAQDNHVGLPAPVVTEWIVPQWFFQQCEGAPGRLQIVGVLIDEFGNERHTAIAPTPWRSSETIEERPHATFGSGAELRELAQGWKVLVVPDPQRASRATRRTPLAGRRILWVDDNPNNNRFEVTYLEQLGATVSYAASTKFALESVERGETDLIISDIGRVENGVRRDHAGLELHDQLEVYFTGRTSRIPLIFYNWNRDLAPPEIRPVTADEPNALFKLAEVELGVR